MCRPQSVLTVLHSEAHKSGQRYQHSAGLLVRGKNCIYGHNQYTHGVLNLHAEQAAVVNLMKNLGHRNAISFFDFSKPLTDSVAAHMKPLVKSLNLPKNMKMIVIRVKRDSDDLGNSRPCSNCISYLRLFGIKSVLYSTDTGELLQEKVADMDKNHESSGARFIRKSFCQMIQSDPHLIGCT